MTDRTRRRVIIETVVCAVIASVGAWIALTAPLDATGQWASGIAMAAIGGVIGAWLALLATGWVTMETTRTDERRAVVAAASQPTWRVRWPEATGCPSCGVPLGCPACGWREEG